MDCPKSMVGRIIGRGGETIKDLQRRFGTSIQIDQAATPCKVTIAGPNQAVTATRRAIDDLLGPGVMGPPPGAAPFGALRQLGRDRAAGGCRSCQLV